MKSSLIYNVLAGIANDREKAAVKKWIVARGVNRREFEELKKRFEQDFDAAGRPPEEGLTRIRIRTALRRSKQRLRQQFRAALGFVLVPVTAFILAYAVSLRFHANSRMYTFDHQPIGTIIETLERDYHVRIEVADRALRSCPFSGAFYNEPVEAILRQVSASTHLHLIVGADGMFTLWGNGCSR